VIDYETYARIRDCRDRQGLTITQIASTLGLHRETVAKWLARSRFERPRPAPRASLLDPFKGRITRLLDTHPYSAQQIFRGHVDGRATKVSLVGSASARPRKDGDCR